MAEHTKDINDTKSRILDTTWRLMEAAQGQGVKMSDIARDAGISRQAIYLHFASRTELMIATVSYVDEVKGLEKRLGRFQSARTGIEFIDACVEIWGDYIPEIYGLAKTLMRTRHTDEAAAAAWQGTVNCLRKLCQATIQALKSEGTLANGWSEKEAIETLLTLISIENWEQLTVEYGWSNERYIERMKTLLKRTFVEEDRSLKG